MLEEKRICAFIDILGFKNEILSSDDKRKDAIINLLKQTLNEDSEQDLNTENFGLATISYPSAEVTSFSDNIVISCNLEPICRKIQLADRVQNIKESPAKYIEHIFSKIISVYWKALQLGLLFRGGITVGNLYHKDRVVVGEALINSYELETKTSYPRIEISEEVIDIIKSYDDFRDNDYASMFLYKDNKYIVNTFGFHIGVWRDYAYYNNIENIEYKTIIKVVDNIILMAQDNHLKYLKINEHKIAIKWKWFIDALTEEYNRGHWLQLKNNIKNQGTI